MLYQLYQLSGPKLIFRIEQCCMYQRSLVVERLLEAEKASVSDENAQVRVGKQVLQKFGIFLSKKVLAKQILQQLILI